MTDQERDQINCSDLEKINAAADYLNSEMEGVLSHQADLFGNTKLADDLLSSPIRVPTSNADIEK